MHGPPTDGPSGYRHRGRALGASTSDDRPSERRTAFGPPAATAPAAADEQTVTGTGTTTVALTAGDAVVLAADRRASLAGRFVSNKDVRKIEPVHPTAAATISGSVGAAQAFLETLRAEAALYGNRRGEPMGMEALSTTAATLVRGMPVVPLLGGVDDTGPHLYELDGGGARLPTEYGAAGSGMQLAYGVLEGAYEPDLDRAAAVRTVADAVASAVERDTASGNGLTVGLVTADGVALEAYDDVAAVRAGATDVPTPGADADREVR